MKSLASLVLAAAPLAKFALAQDSTPYTDKETNIAFTTWSVPDITYGLALPADALEKDATEFIGLLTCTSADGAGTGWCGVSFGGGMVNNLLLLAYPHKDQVLTSFRWANEYGPPELYTGEATLTQISSTINDTAFSVIFRCEGCLQWKQGDIEGSAATTSGLAVTGWAHAKANVRNPDCADTAGVGRHDTQGILPARFDAETASSDYEEWVGLATETVSGTCGGGDAPAPPPSEPEQPAQPPAGGSGCAETYTVPAGSYCYLIATDHGLTLEQFLELNAGLNCEGLQVGQDVCVKALRRCKKRKL